MGGYGPWVQREWVLWDVGQVGRLRCGAEWLFTRRKRSAKRRQTLRLANSGLSRLSPSAVAAAAAASHPSKLTGDATGTTGTTASSGVV